MDDDDAPKPLIRLDFVTSGRFAEVPQGTNLLRASMRHEGGIPFKCGGGICGTCRCQIEAGGETLSAVTKKERKHLTDADLAAGARMACQTFAEGPVSVSWGPLDQRRKQG